MKCTFFLTEPSETTEMLLSTAESFVNSACPVASRNGTGIRDLIPDSEAYCIASILYLYQDYAMQQGLSFIPKMQNKCHRIVDRNSISR